MPLLLQFAGQHEAVHKRVSFTDRFVDIVDEGIDLSVRIGSVESQLATRLAKQGLASGRPVQVFPECSADGHGCRCKAVVSRPTERECR